MWQLKVFASCCKVTFGIYLNIEIFGIFKDKNGDLFKSFITANYNFGA